MNNTIIRTIVLGTILGNFDGEKCNVHFESEMNWHAYNIIMIDR